MDLVNVVRKFGKIENPTTQNSKVEKEGVSNNTLKLFSTDKLKLFLGNDTEALKKLLQTFANDTLKNKLALAKAKRENNPTKLSAVAHRMLPMFRQMDINSCIPILDILEKLHDNDIKTLTIEVDKLDVALENLLAVLQETNFIKHPDHTV